MANRMAVVIAIVFFAVTSVVAFAADPLPQPVPAGAAAVAEGPEAENVIGGISGVALDAAPVGGPVSGEVFANLGAGGANGHRSGTAATPAGVTFAAATAGFVGSIFFFF